MSAQLELVPEERKPFPRYDGCYTLTNRQLAQYEAKKITTGAQITHADCGEIVARIGTGTELALVLAAIAGHRCETGQVWT